MRILSVNVGKPRDLTWKGRTLRTAIVKEPVQGTVIVRRLNLEGDGQASLDVHGGEDKAVYLYPAGHYDFWRQELPEAALAPGSFGENLTAEGASESVQVGARFRLGTAEMTVTEPRFPCSKLAARVRRADMQKRFLDSRRTGFYLSVQAEGTVAAGDSMEPIAPGPGGLSIADVVELYAGSNPDRALLQLACEHPALPAPWREHFRRKLAERG